MERNSKPKESKPSLLQLKPKFQQHAANFTGSSPFAVNDFTFYSRLNLDFSLKRTSTWFLEDQSQQTHNEELLSLFESFWHKYCITSFFFLMTFLQIMAHPNAHRQYAVRLDSKNAKTRHKELPDYVKQFIIGNGKLARKFIFFTSDFCLSSYGYPPQLRFADYSLSNLSCDNPA